MERIKIIFAIFVSCLGFSSVLQSCTDKDDDPVIPAAKYVAGTYTGDMTSSVMGEESVFENLMFEVTATDASTVSIKTSSFGNPPMKMPEMTIPGIMVSGENGKYILTPTDFDLEVDGKKCSGTIQGSFLDKRITINFTLNYGAMPMPLICSFTANKK